MNEYISKVVTWVKANILIAGVIILAVTLLFFSKGIKKLFGGTRRIRHRRPAVIHHTTRRRRTLPRSVGIKRRKSPLNKSGKAKKAWQIKGSPAARRHMAQIRAMR